MFHHQTPRTPTNSAGDAFDTCRQVMSGDIWQKVPRLGHVLQTHTPVGLPCGTGGHWRVPRGTEYSWHGLPEWLISIQHVTKRRQLPDLSRRASRSAVLCVQSGPCKELIARFVPVISIDMLLPVRQRRAYPRAVHRLQGRLGVFPGSACGLADCPDDGRVV